MSHIHAQTLDEDLEVVPQLVTFKVSKELFGIPMKLVGEIIRMPNVVQVPLTPNALVGLANLRGNVLPIVNLRSILGLEVQPYTESTRVLVADIGYNIGLIVDCVSKVIPINEDNVKNTDIVDKTAKNEFVSGVLKDDEQLIQILDTSCLLENDFEHVVSRAKSNQAQTTSQKESLNESANEGSQLVSFSIDTEEYAFDLMEVEEILRVPEDIVEIANTEPHILGMIDLRGRLLPLINLRVMFDFTAKPLDDSSRVLVVGLRAVGGTIHSIGLVVDDVKEVLMVQDKDKDKVPQLINNQHNDISAICRLNQGKRLVSIINTEVVFTDPSIQNVVADNEQDSDMNKQNDNDKADAEQDNETQMVIFKLADQEYGITIDYVQEITRVPETMSQVPKTADFIDGMVNLRGTILPVIDMRTRFGLERMQENDRQRILVLTINGKRTGFVMDSVVEVIRLSMSDIEEAPELSTDQTRMIGRLVNLREQNRIIQVLDGNELLDDKEKKTLETI